MIVATELEKETIASQHLFDLFRRFVDSDMLFLEPGGNFGDHLIYKGAYKLANLAGVKFQSMNFSKFQDKDMFEEEVLYIHGGGGFVPWWSGRGRKILKRLAAEYRGRVILGPTTFLENEDYTKTILDECVGGHNFKEFFIFTRDKNSYSILKNCMPCNGEIICDHDTAFNLVKSDLVREEVPREENKYVLFAMRYEKERPETQPYNYFKWVDPIDVCSSFDKWLSFHLKAKKLFTNRAHSTVLGTILGIPTTMLPNNYHKNRSLWEFSLQDRGVEWRDYLDCATVNELIEGSPFLRRCFTSGRYKKLLKMRLDCLGF